MVAKATNRKAVPVYEARGFRSGETVGALVALARNALWEEFGREVEPLGLNATQAAVMIALATEARTAADLSRTLTHDTGAMTRVVDQLEEMGLARRVRLERDYRRQRVELTAEGRKMHAQLVQVQIASLNRMLRGILPRGGAHARGVAEAHRRECARLSRPGRPR